MEPMPWISEREEAWKKRLEREVEKRKKLEELHHRALAVAQNSSQKVIVRVGPDYEEGPHSTIGEEEFYDAVETGLDKLEEEQEFYERLRAKQGTKFNSKSSAHPLWKEIDRVSHEQLEYALKGVEDGVWQLFAEDGEMRMYKREEEVNGLAVDPLKAVHTVKGVTGRELCHYFYDPSVRLEWESTVENLKVLETVAEDTHVVLQIHKRIWPASQRDSLFWSHVRRVPNEQDRDGHDIWIVCNNSTSHSEAPPLVEMEYKIPSDILDDLGSRFIINVPEEERKDLVRVCFQVELAHWFYLDYYCSEEKSTLKACGFKEFALNIFKHVSFLHFHAPSLDLVLVKWREYKQAVPTFGAILINEEMTHVLLVQGFWSKSSWGFPKGKVNEGEDPAKCAAREVFEETNFDMSHLMDPNDYLETTVHDQLTRLYVVSGVPYATKFTPRTRNEIRSIQWFPVQDLPLSKKDNTPKVKLGLSSNCFFLVFPFVKLIRNWIAAKQQKAHLIKIRNKDMEMAASARKKGQQNFIKAIEEEQAALMAMRQRKTQVIQAQNLPSPGVAAKHKFSPRKQLFQERVWNFILPRANYSKQSTAVRYRRSWFESNRGLAVTLLADNVYRLCKAYAQNRKESEKVVKNIIKIVVKVGILAKNDQFSPEDLKIADQFRSKFHTTAMTVISFHEVDFSYDQKFILQLVTDCRSLLKQLVQRHLTDKSLGRIDLVFSFFGQPAFLDAIFKRPSEHHELMCRIVQDMHTLLDAGDM
nr:EOG090X07NG [Lepidurus arcticus]